MLFLQLNQKEQAWLDAWYGNAEMIAYCMGLLLVLVLVFSARRIIGYYKDKSKAQIEWEQFEKEVAELKAQKENS